ncbi:hypothetical protein [Frigoribacterium sp. CFBP 13712]|uniref:hypothetical protein n=1 Tax=Frigoribacterium sp. CFBP 13712 TaxID=2775309 RepID=UPI0017810E17|nr:hypothetical protein [Frigoribacterium sp. CFBP 13712]MBD8703017.1 hypothetical protein [Frigoribacterium sp. CFBP 13712]
MVIDRRPYFRQVASPARRLVFTRGESEYEVMSSPGVIRRVPLSQVREALGASPTSRRDFQECDMTAAQLFREGSDLWVEYPTGITVSTGELFTP